MHNGGLDQVGFDRARRRKLPCYRLSRQSPPLVTSRRGNMSVAIQGLSATDGLVTVARLPSPRGRVGFYKWQTRLAGARHYFLSKHRDGIHLLPCFKNNYITFLTKSQDKVFEISSNIRF